MDRSPWKRTHISGWFFGAAVFAHFPSVSALEDGDDFSNNLFSDLAPILTLFGEQVLSCDISASVENIS